MKRSKRHKIKTEPSENRSNRIGDSSGGLERDFDLAHYIHDRVELLQRAFAALKPRELKTMAPACVAGLSLDDLQELCLEELLGISSVRLCAILDGADPPSNTESSDSSGSPSAGHLETISLDSISSDEETLNPPPAPTQRESKPGKHKRRCRRKEARKAEAAAKKDEPQSESQSRTRTAERAGMTVLELLELQARARAIRAQLAMEKKHATQTDTKARIGDESDNDVQIKEEPPEVVELSSDDELQHTKVSVTSNHQAEKLNESRIQAPSPDESQNQANNKSDLVIVVPNTQTRKIKLKRNKIAMSVSQESANLNKNIASLTEQVKVINVESKTIDFVSKTKSTDDQHEKDKEKGNLINQKDKIRHSKQKKKRNKHKTAKEIEGSDHDEITLQLSDTEKMDLLEDFDRKNVDIESSSESDTSTDGGVTETMSVAGSTDNLNNTSIKSTTSTNNKLENHTQDSLDSLPKSAEGNSNSKTVEKVLSVNTTSENKDDNLLQDSASEENVENFVPDIQEVESYSTNQTKTNKSNESVTNDTNLQYSQKQPTSKNNDLSEGEISDQSNFDIETRNIKEPIYSKDKETIDEKNSSLRKDEEIKKLESKNIKLGTEALGDTRQSEGDDICEILEIKTTEEKHGGLHKFVNLQQTDTENILGAKDLGDTRQNEGDNEKKLGAKDLSVTRPSENDDCEILEIETTEEKHDESHKDVVLKETNAEKKLAAKDLGDTRQSESDDIYEILEISDDSSCYEVEGVSVLSKEPTTEEIEAFSAKIDHEIHREQATGEEDDNLENISWKHRYLDSKKVKRIMSTANILNALRKKNKELKKKIEESKNQTEHETPDQAHKQPTVEEGTVNHYNTLEGSTKYVAPPTVPTSEEMEKIEENSERLHKEMEKDAKQLLKMYKRLLKYNDMNKESRSKKPKKKKKRKEKEKTSNNPSK